MDDKLEKEFDWVFSLFPFRLTPIASIFLILTENTGHGRAGHNPGKVCLTFINEELMSHHFIAPLPNALLFLHVYRFSFGWKNQICRTFKSCWKRVRPGNMRPATLSRVKLNKTSQKTGFIPSGTSSSLLIGGTRHTSSAAEMQNQWRVERGWEIKIEIFSAVICWFYHYLRIARAARQDEIVQMHTEVLGILRCVLCCFTELSCQHFWGRSLKWQPTRHVLQDCILNKMRGNHVLYNLPWFHMREKRPCTPFWTFCHSLSRTERYFQNLSQAPRLQIRNTSGDCPWWPPEQRWCVLVQ